MTLQVCPHTCDDLEGWLLNKPAEPAEKIPQLDAQALGAAALLKPTRIPTPAENWFDRYLANDKQARKEAPLARGLHGYFPNACLHVARVSFVANEQHNPGLPLQWAFDKSSDEPDCELRHMLDAMGASGANPFDDDGLLHRAKKAWRALADLERFLLMHYPKAQPGASVTGFTRESAPQENEK